MLEILVSSGSIATGGSCAGAGVPGGRARSARRTHKDGLIDVVNEHT